MSELGSNLSPTVPKISKAKVNTVAPRQTMRILLEENDQIPSSGLPLGHNGKTYLLRPGEEVDVPMEIVNILNNAVESTPQVDPQTKQVIGYRDRLRYSYRVVSSGGDA